MSCSNNDKTGSSGIEQYNGNTYVSKDSFDLSSLNSSYKTAYIWVSIKDGKVGMFPNDNNTTAPNFTGIYMTGPITGSGTDYTFDSGDGTAAGTLKFTSDGSSVTVNFAKNTAMPSIVGKDIVCNIKK